jgi:hypothetical protein
MTIQAKRTLIFGISVLLICLSVLLVACGTKSEAPGPRGTAGLETPIDPFEIQSRPEIEFVEGVPIFP